MDICLINIVYVHDQVGVCSTELFHLREIKHTESFLKINTNFELSLHLRQKIFLEENIIFNNKYISLNLTFLCVQLFNVGLFWVLLWSLFTAA